MSLEWEDSSKGSPKGLRIANDLVGITDCPLSPSLPNPRTSWSSQILPSLGLRRETFLYKEGRTQHMVLSHSRRTPTSWVCGTPHHDDSASPSKPTGLCPVSGSYAANRRQAGERSGAEGTCTLLACGLTPAGSDSLEANDLLAWEQRAKLLNHTIPEGNLEKAPRDKSVANIPLYTACLSCSLRSRRYAQGRWRSIS